MQSIAMHEIAEDVVSACWLVVERVEARQDSQRGRLCGGNARVMS
jgi:hypothetical protein